MSGQQEVCLVAKPYVTEIVRAQSNLIVELLTHDYPFNFVSRNELKLYMYPVGGIYANLHRASFARRHKRSQAPVLEHYRHGWILLFANLPQASAQIGSCRKVEQKCGVVLEKDCIVLFNIFASHEI